MLVAHHELFAAGGIMAVLDALGCRTALGAVADGLGVSGEVDGHAVVEDVERAVPETCVAILFAVAHDSAVELVDLAESAAAHEGGEHFTADAAGAVCDDGSALEVVVLATVEFGDEVAGGVNIRNYCISESADRRLDGVAAVKEGNVCAGNEFVEFFGAELGATTHHTVFVYLQFAGCAETDDFVAHLHAQSGKVVALALAPFEVDVLESGILASFADVALHVFEFATDGAIHAILREDDATAEPEGFTEVALPQPYSVGVGQRREHVEEKDLGNSHAASLRGVGPGHYR